MLYHHDRSPLTSNNITTMMLITTWPPMYTTHPEGRRASLSTTTIAESLDPRVCVQQLRGALRAGVGSQEAALKADPSSRGCPSIPPAGAAGLGRHECHQGLWRWGAEATAAD